MSYSPSLAAVQANASPLPQVPRAREGVALCAVLGLTAVAVGFSYSVAARSSSGFAYFHLFFAALVIANGYVLWRIISTTLNAAWTVFWLVAMSTLSYLPHYVRSPTRPYMGDEFAHFLQANNMFDQGRLFTSNSLVPQSSNFPGFEALTIAVREMTGLATFRAGTVVLLLCHLIALFGMYHLGRSLGTAKLGVIAAFLYSISPQFTFFDSLYSYESLGVPLAISVFALAIGHGRGHGTLSTRALTYSMVLVLAADLITHHASSYVAIVLISMVGLFKLVSRSRSTELNSTIAKLCIGVAGAVGAIVWADLRNANLVPYLTVNLTNGLQAITSRVKGTDQVLQANAYVPTTASRQPLAGVHQPIYETASAYISPFLLLTLFVVALWKVRSRLSVEWLVILVLAAGYFLLLPLLFTASGQNVVHRSWAFTYVGLSVISAVALLPTLERTPGRRRAAINSRPGWLIALILAPFLVIGSYGQGTSYIPLFPGPFLYQSDGRNVQAELYDLGSWIAQLPGASGSQFIADRRTSIVITAYSGAYSEGRLGADLILSPRPSAATIALTRLAISYVVIDKRMTTEVSYAGPIFWTYEPLVTQPLDVNTLLKLRAYPWLTIIHETANYMVFKVAK